MDNFKRPPVNRVARPAQAPVPVNPPVAPVPNARPVAPVTTPVQSPLPQQANASAPAPGQYSLTPPPVEPPTGLGKSKKSKKKPILWVVGILITLVLAAAAAAFMWYNTQLSAVNPQDTTKKLVTIQSGTTPTGIAELLKEEGLIRDQSAFLWYTRIEGVQNQLQAGAYRLSPSETTQEIVKHLNGGNVDTFDITFLPGETLAKSRQTLINAGYTAAEVDAALKATYDSPLFAGKPASADLEGYIYGDTYKFGAGTTVEGILEYVFAAFYAVVQKNDLVAKFEANGLSLYEGITLASIVQRESIGGDEPQIAQVFYTRLETGMMLGSDVTYQYIADKTSVPRDTNLDSPYNTRRYTGLTPGPISAPGINSLLGVANPAPGDYIYFLSGDDDVTYFGRTLDEHEANIRNHCQKKCQII